MRGERRGRARLAARNAAAPRGAVRRAGASRAARGPVRRQPARDRGVRGAARDPAPVRPGRAARHHPADGDAVRVHGRDLGDRAGRRRGTSRAEPGRTASGGGGRPAARRGPRGDAALQRRPGAPRLAGRADGRLRARDPEHLRRGQPPGGARAAGGGARTDANRLDARPHRRPDAGRLPHRHERHRGPVLGRGGAGAAGTGGGVVPGAAARGGAVARLRRATPVSGVDGRCDSSGWR